MKWPFPLPRLAGSLLLLVSLLVGSATDAVAQDDKIAQEIVEALKTNASAAILVGLKVPWQREESLSPAQLASQREAIRRAQDQLLSELEGSSYRIARRFHEIPAIALEGDTEAVARLADSTIVTNVLLDKPLPSTSTKPPDVASTATPAPSQEETEPGYVPTAIFALAKAQGSVLVLVGIKAPWQPEDSLPAPLIAAQRKIIAAAQDYLLLELGNSQFNVVKRYERVPAIALEVGIDALKILDDSGAVTNILPDRPPQPAGNSDTVP